LLDLLDQLDPMVVSSFTVSIDSSLFIQVILSAKLNNHQPSLFTPYFLRSCTAQIALFVLKSSLTSPKPQNTKKATLRKSSYASIGMT